MVRVDRIGVMVGVFAVAALASRVEATTYIGSELLNGAGATYTITTDGALGTLAESDITSFSVNEFDSYGTVRFSTATGGRAYFFDGASRGTDNGALVASPTSLTFDFTKSDGGVYFYGYTYFGPYGLPNQVDLGFQNNRIFDSNGPEIGITTACCGAVITSPRTGVQTIATTSGFSPNASQLALMSGDVYSAHATGKDADGKDIPGYKLLTQVDYGDGFKSALYKTVPGGASPPNYVVAFRGSEPVDQGKDYVADAAIGLDVSNALFSAYLKDAAQTVSLLKKSGVSGAQITLTGHSLGGAVAQLVGEASGLTATVFDAPGVQQYYPANAAELSSLSGFGRGGLSTNYRLYGDQVSLAGTQVGQVITVGTSGGPSSVLDLLGIYNAHLPKNIINAVVAGDDLTAGAIGPNLVPQIYALVLPFLVTPTGLGQALLFTVAVNEVDHYYIDPGSYEQFDFLESAGSPFLSSVALPQVSGVAYYTLSYETGDSWSAPAELLPLTTLSLGGSVDGLRYEGFDANGNPVDAPSSYLIDLTFSESGTVTADLVETSSSVPEPAGWVFMLFGMLAVGCALRRKSLFSRMIQKTRRVL